MADRILPEARHERDTLVRRHAIVSGDTRLVERARGIVEAASADWLRAPAVIARGLREAHGLPSPERRLLGEMVHGFVRHRRRLAFLAGRDDARAMLLAWLARPPEEISDQELEPSVAQVLRRAGVDPARVAHPEDAFMLVGDPIEKIGVALSYPDWIVARVCDAFGRDGGRALLEAMNRRAPLTVRANPLRGDRTQLAERLAELGIPSTPTKLAREGLVLDTHRNVYELAPFRDGAMELQDEGSQLLAEIVAVPPRGAVIDACAGAGGKTLALGGALANRGRLVALDVSDEKLIELRKRARRAGLTNVAAIAVAPDGPLPPLPAGITLAERVLVDAPCSGLGVVRRNPETKWRLQPGDLVELAAKQAAILARYSSLVKPGGRLVYGTCAVLPEENDRVVDGFLAAHAGWEAVPLKEVLGKERALALGDGERLRLVPHLHDTDGFFGAILRRTH